MTLPPVSGNFSCPGRGLNFPSASTLSGYFGRRPRSRLKFSSVNLSLLPPAIWFTVLSWKEDHVRKLIFTHHQKCVIVDMQASGNIRRITSFIGGIDLCEGRYDTPEHRLFHDRDTVFKDHSTYPVLIYHKGMIVDDEYVIVGSANINERSMAGTRDTEIAMGAYQPHHAWAKNKRHPHGQIYGYRNSLWAEHLGELEPESLECVRTVKPDRWRQRG